MMKSLFPCAILLLLFATTEFTHGESSNLSVDQTRSTIDVSINSSPTESSQLSGASAIDLTSSSTPFGVAQITALQIILDDGLNFDLGPMVTGTTQPDEIRITMITPGAGGSVTGGVFDQLENELSLSGFLAIEDPNGLFGGSRSIDLSTIDVAPVDFVGNEVSRAGDTISLSGSFLLNEQIPIGGGVFVPLTADVAFVATGEVVPEPSGTLLLIGCFCLGVSRRFRSS